MYTDDSIITGSDWEEIMNIVDGIKVEGLDITNEGYIQDFLGDNMYKVIS